VAAKTQRPYKVVPYEPQAADVIDRATGEKIGYVLKAYNGWEAFSLKARGVPLVFETIKAPEAVRQVLGDTHEVKLTAYRADAAERVWAEWRKI
jgi:hypothetical protein